MRLRTLLLLLVLATGLPVAAFAILSAYLVVNQEESAYVNAVRDRNRAFISAVDAELNGHIRALRTLGAARSLADDRLEDFYNQALKVLATQPSWTNINLNDAHGRQLVNLAAPPGASLPTVPAEAKSFQEAATKLQPSVGNLIEGGPFKQPPSIPVRVPVVREGKLVYVLTAVVSPESFAVLIRRQELPSGWVSGLVDGNGRFIARVPPRPVGTMASQRYLEEVAKSREGWYRGLTVEGLDTYTAHAASQLSAWTVGYAIPKDLVLAGPRRAAWVMGISALLCLALALGGAVLLATRISGPISRLVEAAPALGRSARMPEIRSSVREVNTLAHALNRASELINSRDAELRRRAVDLERADTNKTHFLATLSHELRNPLAPIANGLALLDRQSGDAAAQTRAMMQRQVGHLRRLIDDLLDVSRIDRGKIGLRRERLALHTIVSNAVETVRPFIDAKSQQLIVRYAAEPTVIDGDLVRLSQVVANLMHNASKFTPNGGSIEVATASAGGEATITVTDTGIGFAPDDAERIFDMFVQLDTSRSLAAGGLGLGLTLARSLTRMHDGRVEARSEGAGRGATFTVHLPVVQPGTAMATLAPSRAQSYGRRRILVVDDNADAADSMAQNLRIEGLEVRACYLPEHALTVAREFKPEVAFLDLNLPGMDGVELGRRMREQAGGSSILLVALTGMGQTSDIAATRAAGFEAHLTKPASADAVLAIVAGLRDNIVSLSSATNKKNT
jgi:signal transduction histidine kinase/CheY-like chemotaxis protein